METRRRWQWGFVALAAAAGAAAWLWVSRPPAPPPLPARAADTMVRTTLEVARDAVIRMPRSATAWGELGMSFAANFYAAEAETCYRRAASFDERDPTWPHLLAVLLRRQDRGSAIAWARESVRRSAASAPADESLVPSVLATRLLLAELLLEEGEPEEAAEIGAPALANEAAAPRAHLVLGWSAAARADWVAAERHFVAATASPQARKQAAEQLAQVALRRGDQDQSRLWQSRARAWPNDVPWEDPYLALERAHAVSLTERLQRVRQLRAAGQRAEAVRLLGELAALYQGPADHELIGMELVHAGAFLRAEQLLRKALEAAPEANVTRVYLAAALYEQGAEAAAAKRADQAQMKWRAALPLVELALRAQAQDAMGHWVHGLVLRGLGRGDEAVTALERATALRPDSYDFHADLGAALAALGRRDDARRHLRLAVELAPPDERRAGRLLQELED